MFKWKFLLLVGLVVHVTLSLRNELDVSVLSLQVLLQVGGRVTSGGEQLSPRAECALHRQVIFLPLNIFKIITESPPVETSFLLLVTFLWKRACRCWRFHFSPSVFEGAALLLAAGCRPIGDGKWYLLPNPDQSLFHSRPPPLPFPSVLCVVCLVCDEGATGKCNASN